jgi:hypothetical protein
MDQSYAPPGWAGGSLNKSAMERLVGNLVGNELTLIGIISKIEIELQPSGSTTLMPISRTNRCLQKAARAAARSDREISEIPFQRFLKAMQAKP